MSFAFDAKSTSLAIWHASVNCTCHLLSLTSAVQQPKSLTCMQRRFMSIQIDVSSKQFTRIFCFHFLNWVTDSITRQRFKGVWYSIKIRRSHYDLIFFMQTLLPKKTFFKTGPWTVAVFVWNIPYCHIVCLKHILLAPNIISRYFDTFIMSLSSHNQLSWSIEKVLKFRAYKALID